MKFYSLMWTITIWTDSLSAEMQFPSAILQMIHVGGCLLYITLCGKTLFLCDKRIYPKAVRLVSGQDTYNYTCEEKDLSQIDRSLCVAFLSHEGRRTHFNH